MASQHMARSAPVERARRAGIDAVPHRTMRVVVLVLALAASAVAVAVIAHLQSRATASRDAEKQLVTLRLYMSQIQEVPWGAAPDNGDDPQDVAGELQGDRAQIEHILAELDRSEGLPDRAAIVQPFHRVMGALWEIYRDVQDGADPGPASEVSARQAAKADTALRRAAGGYRARSVHALREAEYGSAAMIALLFVAFAWFYWLSARSRRAAETAARQNERLAEINYHDAITDALTGLRNRRALLEDLDDITTDPPAPTLLAMFDLNGFKGYNDTFGHPAGDALLARVSARLAEVLDGVGTAYRMGGDEFCVLAPLGPDADPDLIVSMAADALSEWGTGFVIGCGQGSALIPSEADTASDALRLADRRMYAHKASERVPASRQSADVLRTMLAERDGRLRLHSDRLARYAAAVAGELGLSQREVDQVCMAADLHGIGKAAIPETILNKPAELDTKEWSFVRRHPEIAQRVTSAAPSLTPIGRLLRSQAEHYDGTGYPDGLAGEQIPLAARIVAVIGAFVAMTSERPYQAAMSVDEALAELSRHAGTQFDPAVVDAFRAILRKAA